MRTYIKVFFDSEGASPGEVVNTMHELGWKTVVGEYDFVWEGGISDSVGSLYLDQMNKLHAALKGLKVKYTIISQR